MIVVVVVIVRRFRPKRSAPNVVANTCVWCRQPISEGQAAIECRQAAWGDSRARMAHLPCEVAALKKHMGYMWFFIVLGVLGIVPLAGIAVSELLSRDVNWRNVEFAVTTIFTVSTPMTLVCGIVVPWARRVREAEWEQVARAEVSERFPGVPDASSKETPTDLGNT